MLLNSLINGQSHMNRDSMLKNAEQTPYWDVIVIGGGASGLWCAYDAALRGYKTILIEQGDFACSTSSKSTKLIHGGVRYLKQGHLTLVREALLERRYLSLNAPHLVSSRSFVIPYYRAHERLMYGLGMGIYDFFAGPMGNEMHRYLPPNEILKKCPTLRTDQLRGGCLFNDGQFDDSRFAIEIAKMAHHSGGTLLNYVKASSLIKQGGKIVGVEAKDLINDTLMELTGKVVINATGIFADQIRKMDDKNVPKMMSLARGSHIVLDRQFLPLETAIVIPKTSDNRIAFMIPWHHKVLVGTTDIETNHPLREAAPTHEEIDFLLDASGYYLNKRPKREDVLSAFAGIRPLVKKSIKSTAKLSRTHKVMMSDSGMISLLGGKWTTGRKMAEDTIDYAIYAGHLERSLCLTHRMPFEGTSLLHKGEPLHPSLPYTEDDLEIAIDHEMVQDLTDLLARRTRSLLLDARATLEIAPKVATKLQKKLMHTDAWRHEQVEKFKTFAGSYILK